MAGRIRPIHPDALARALRGWTGAFDLEAADSLRGSLRRHLELIERIGADLSHPALGLFSALALQPGRFDEALKRHRPDSLDDSLYEAARKAGALPPSAPMHGSEALMGALQWCAVGDLWREAQALLECGADANLYAAGGTAVGMAAYSGSGRTLARMAAAGVDVALHLPAEHAGGSRHSSGSTLLHRVCERPIRHRDQIAAMLARCEASYPDLDRRTDEGLTAMDKARRSGDSKLVDALLLAMAEREAGDIALSIPAPQASRHAATL